MTDLPFARTWLPFLYLYGAGGVIFLGGMVFIIKAKAIDLGNRKERRWWRVLIFGYVYYFALHGILTLAALHL